MTTFTNGGNKLQQLDTRGYVCAFFYIMEPGHCEELGDPSMVN
jgi:hypothetical protein